MILLEITQNDAGQRLDKYLKRRLRGAPNSFLYKMLRKKNIVLNGKKAAGNELLCEKDEIKLFLSDETYEKFCGVLTEETTDISLYQKAYQTLGKMEIVFENGHFLILNKPAGVLSQKAASADLSANEWLIGYLLRTGFVTQVSLSAFKPSVCNRLDRNTSGLLTCSKTLPGSQYLSRIIKDKSLEKYYYALAEGELSLNQRANGWLCKDARQNKAAIYQREADIPEALKKSAEYIDTAFRTIKTSADKTCTLLEVQLFTGKTHQIRAQLGAMGYPIVGDKKYGARGKHDTSVTNQLLHAYKLVFPKTEDKRFLDVSGKTVVCAPPKIFEQMLGVKIDGDMEFEGASRLAP